MLSVPGSNDLEVGMGIVEYEPGTPFPGVIGRTTDESCRDPAHVAAELAVPGVVRHDDQGIGGSLLRSYLCWPRRATNFDALAADSIEPSAPVLLVGLALALFAQGAYYSRAQWFVGLILLGGVVLVPGVIRLGAANRGTAAVTGGLAGWALLDGYLHDAPHRGLPYVVLMAAFLTLLVSCAGLPKVSGEWLVGGLIAAGVAVGLLGWLGVLFHEARWAFQSDGLWRASATLTYPNAAAAVLAVLALLALAELSQRPVSASLGLAATALITGLAATLSRAGLIGFCVGLFVLAACLGPWLVLRRGMAPMLGSMMATAGLVPAMTAHTPIRVAGAVAALIVGCCAGAFLPRLRSRWHAATAALTAVVLLVPIALSEGVRHSIGALAASRATLASPDRAASNLAAWHLFEGHPWFGVGPGLKQLAIAGPDGGVSTFRYAHNEYLQVLAELGAIGALLLLAVLFVILRRLYRARSTSGVLGIGVLAGMAALAVHAGFDFIWHFPAIPLLAAVLVGLAVSDPPSGHVQPIPNPQRKEPS
jgi:O-Antigen ligase